MRYTLADVIRRALTVLDEYGLADLSMRRLASELGVQPSALYHHVANKQQLLALLADEVLRRGARPIDEDAPWPEQVKAICVILRDAMLAWRDGAELVSTVYAFGLGANSPVEQLITTLRAAGFAESTALTGAKALLYVTFGHTGAMQTHLQAASAGAIEAPVDITSHDDLAAALELVTTGLREHLRSEA
ncbi:TetR family transcriptional regulator [Cumulibacter soli]|uniref:TetR family transcriptional regulator n=1 Tax=Cumulibacter soli TaxID=2546344 RepID=UPI0010673C42|nr:TetR family transcriptional regulator [Cumulibacter soli]